MGAVEKLLDALKDGDQKNLTSLILVLLGIMLIVLGAAGTIPFITLSVSDFLGRTVVIAGGSILSLGGLVALLFGMPAASINAKKFGIKITHPLEGSSVGMNFNVSGTYEKKPPKSVRAEIFQRYAANTYRPRRQIIFGNDGKWTARKVFSGNKPGVEFAAIVMLVGQDGQTLIDYYDKVGREGDPKTRPSFEKLTSDMVEGDSVNLVVQDERARRHRQNRSKR